MYIHFCEFLVGQQKKCARLFEVNPKAFEKQLSLPLENNEIGRA